MNSAAIVMVMIASWVSVVAQDLDTRINRASELVPLCQRAAEAAYRAADIPTFQWTASYQDYADRFEVRGKLRAGGEDVTVQCSLVSGQTGREAQVAINDPRL